MSAGIIGFLIGLMIGAPFGMVLTALVTANRIDYDQDVAEVDDEGCK